MMYNCRESCGMCGFRSPRNSNDQVVEGDNFSDMKNKDDFRCGEAVTSKQTLPLVGLVDLFLPKYELRDGQGRFCSGVVINDRFIIGTASCLAFVVEGEVLSVKGRLGTKNEED